MIKPTPQKDKYETTEDLVLNGYKVPKGFQFDGMSAPWFLRSFVGGPYRPRVLEAVILHDFLYGNERVPRKVADQIFYVMLKRERVKCARLFYWAVRIFGGLHRKPHNFQ